MKAPWAARLLRGRGLGTLLLAALAATTFTAHFRLRALREAGRASGRAALARVLSPREMAGAALLGGFRAIAVNLVWLRIVDRLSQQRYADLPLLYEVLDVLQGASPSLYRHRADQMAFDIARKLPHRPEERWSWIRRGLEALEEGRRRFPGDLDLHWLAEVLYYERFHPLRSTADRKRFLAEPRRPGDLVPWGRDPLDLAREAGEAALGDPAHPFKVDQGLWAIYRTAGALAVTSPAPGPEGVSRREAHLARARRLLAHAKAAHRSLPGLEEIVREWEGQIEAEKR